MSLYEALNESPIGSLNPRRTALLIVDMQRYFVTPGHAFGTWVHQADPEGARAYFERVDDIVVPNIQRLQQSFRDADAQIAYTEFGSAREDGRDMPGWARRHNALGHELLGEAVYPPFAHDSCRVEDRIAPQQGEWVVQKTTSGPVNSTKLDQTLRVLGIDTVVVTGVVTDVCVAQTTRELGDRDFEAIVVEDACATLDPDVHRAALGTIGMTFGTVLSTDQVLSLLAHPASD